MLISTCLKVFISSSARPVPKATQDKGSSAIETGKTHFEIRDVEIYDLLVSTADTLAVAARDKSLRLAIHADCRLPRILRTDGEHVLGGAADLDAAHVD